MLIRGVCSKHTADNLVLLAQISLHCLEYETFFFNFMTLLLEFETNSSIDVGSQLLRLAIAHAEKPKPHLHKTNDEVE